MGTKASQVRRGVDLPERGARKIAGVIGKIFLFITRGSKYFLIFSEQKFHKDIFQMSGMNINLVVKKMVQGVIYML